MIISLPIPAASIWPNSRTHWRRKAEITKSHRQAAKNVTNMMISRPNYKPVTYHGYHLAFYYKDARRRDDDNAAASCKAFRDGIADALGVDDNTLKLLEIPTFQIDRENPRVEITLIFHQQTNDTN